MQLEWFGQYRDIFEKLFRAANAYSLFCRKETGGDIIRFSAYEVQIMEHIMEHEDKNMKELADMLGLNPSSFTKAIQKLEEKGLIDKYHVDGNNKNIVLRVSELGHQEYDKYAKKIYEGTFKAMFDKLDELSPEAMKTVEEFIDLWCNAHCRIKEREVDKAEKKLIKIESKSN